jgi:uncharacterized protein (TIGR02757 family)
MQSSNLKAFLNEKAKTYEQRSFIAEDPISIPHQFSKKEDIEIAGFLIATIAWGNRVSILKSGKRMMELMENDPYTYVLHHTPKDLKKLSPFVHRTFNGTDFSYFIRALQHIYRNHRGLEVAFSKNPEAQRMDENIHHFRSLFLSLNTKREQKNTFLIRSADLQQNGSICTYAGWCVLQKTEWILGFGNG